MRSGLRSTSIAALLSVLATACSENLPTSAVAPTEQPVSAPNTPVMALQGYVDLVRGTMTIGTSSPDGLSQSAIYGDQNVTVRLYNSGVVRTTTGTKHRYSANVGLRNLRSHPIGDEQGGDPVDTLGIFVFFTASPAVTRTSSPCPSCAVTVWNPHGTAGFTGLAQPYFHYPERLGPAGSATDSTRNRVTWTFEADTTVLGFSFNVLVSAAWPSPHETAWSVSYAGDSLPDTQSEPRWRLARNGTTPLAAIALGGLTVVAGAESNPTNLYYERYDSLTQDMSATMEARVRINAGTANPHVSFGFDDDKRRIEVGISNGEVGFIDSTYAFIDKMSISTNVFRTYQLRKFRGDSVQLWIDGVHRFTTRYNRLRVRSARAVPSYARFGVRATSAGATSATWGHVVYQLGNVTP